MIITEQKKKIKAQTCPLCSTEQDVIINGWDKNIDCNINILEDKGYSFCNCRNIFFTYWSNINQGTYNPDYHKKYDAPHVDRAYRTTVERVLPKILSNISRETPSILEIGAINPTTLDVFKSVGFNTQGLDIYNHPLGNHPLEVGNFETREMFKKFDVVWASHIFEHFKDPIAAIKKCNEILRDNGILYIAMPDPHFIDFEDPYKWGHWHLREHHILWDMDSFADVLRDNGFQVIHKARNTFTDQICTLDFSIIAKKRIDVKHYS